LYHIPIDLPPIAKSLLKNLRLYNLNNPQSGIITMYIVADE